MKIKDLQKIDLPREKLAKYGVNKLRDYELLAILLGSGIEGLNVLQLSKKILDAIKKIGIKKIAPIKAIKTTKLFISVLTKMLFLKNFKSTIGSLAFDSMAINIIVKTIVAT